MTTFDGPFYKMILLIGLFAAFRNILIFFCPIEILLKNPGK